MTINEKLALIAIAFNTIAFIWAASKIATTAAISQKVVEDLAKTSLNHERRISRLEGKSGIREDS